MTKLVVLFSNLGPYHRDRLISLDRHCRQIGWESIAIELARSEMEYSWKISVENLPFKVISLFPDGVLEKTRTAPLVSRLYAALSNIQPDIVAIAGYSRIAMLSALLWCLWNHKPAILLSATHERDTLRVTWREFFKSQLVKRYHAALVGGIPQKQYLLKLGMKCDSIFIGYNTVGNDRFSPHIIKKLPQVNERPYFLVVSRLIPKKNLLFVIDVYARYYQTVRNGAWDLVICGDGDLYPEIEQKIKNLGLKNHIRLPGFLQQDELLPYFAHARCFIHASLQEQWGLVVNEAMAAGLPVLVSNRCGCFDDLIIEGVNGFGFDPTDNRQLLDLTIAVSSGKVDLDKMGCAARQHIQKFSPDSFASGLIQAAQYAMTGN